MLLSLLFSGVSYPVSKACYALASPLVLQALRFSVGVCAAAAWHRRALRSDDGGPAGRRGALAVGALLALGYTLQSLCLLRVPPATAAFLTAFSVPLTPLVECALRRASPPPRVLGCGLAAAAGTLLLAMGSGGGAATAASLAGPSSAAAGVALGVGAALVFALYFVALSRVAAASPAAAGRLTVAQLGIVAAASWAAAPLDAPPALVASPALAAAVLAVGIASTAATFGLLSWAASRLPASRTSLLFAAEPVVAAAAAWALLGEGLGGRSLAGGLLVLLAIAGA